MKKTILPLLLALSMPFGEVFPNSGTHVEGPRKGFHIEPKLPTPKVSGETAVLEGKFCVWHVVGSINKNPKCRKVKDNEFETHAYWPDPFSEVAIDIDKKAGGREFHYRFTTSQISASDVNILTLLIESKGRHHSNVMHLLHFKARLDRRIVHYEQHKDKMIRRGENQEVIAKFSEFIAKLTSVRFKVVIALDSRPEVLGRLEMPIQVDNNIAAPFISSTIFDGYRLSLDARAGSLIEGDRANTTASIYDMSFKDVKMPAFAEEDSEDDDDQIDDSKKFYYQVLLDNNVLFESIPALFPFNSTVSHNFSTQALSPDNFPSLGLKFIKYEEKDDGTIKTTLWGRLDQELFVSNDNVAPEWIEPILPDPTIRYAQNFPPIDATARDSFGKINPDSINLILNANLIDGTQTTTTLNNINKVSEDSGRSFRIFGDLATLPEGEYSLLFSAHDLAMNAAGPVDLSRIIRVDRTGPNITLAHSSGTLTNNPNLDLHVTVLDHSPKMTTMFHQDQQRLQSAESLFNPSFLLIEGLNFIRAESIDAASNVAVPQTVVIELDTIAPQILNLTPANGAIINTLAFTVSGTSNEKLSQVLVNNALATLSADKKSFSVSISATTEGTFSYSIAATDLANNTTNISRSVDIRLNVLYRDLIAIIPDEETGGLLIVGTVGAAKAGVTVNATASIFNKTSVVAKSDGSFEARLAVFSSVTLSATDPQTNRTDTFVLTYVVDTTLAGVVKDVSTTPLPGVRVTISETGQSAVTDAAGAFRISNPATGDKLLIFDGTVVPLSVSGPNKKYAKMAISVSIGQAQSNILSRPIFMAPLYFDGSETHLTSGQSVEVTSPHAPGVTLKIPAGVTTFPNGGTSGDINMVEIPSSSASVEPLEIAVPNTVIALEPSGTRFSQPIEVTVPNVNEFPEGMQVVIMSRDSVKGIWEVGGFARVSVGGQEITTEPGQGLLHFSEIYASALGPTFKPLGNDDNPALQKSLGINQVSVATPSYKMMGQDIAAMLLYQSNWANPFYLATALLDVPKQEFEFGGSVSVRSLLGKGSASLVGKAWIEPEYVDVQFLTGSINTGKIRYSGVPNKSLMTYAYDLSSFPSGIYPYSSKLEMKLREMIMGTRTYHVKKLFKGARSWQEHFKESRIIEEIFPRDATGNIYVQNKRNSEAGAGWKVAGPGKIINPLEPKLMIEGGDGQLSTYSLNDTIETIYQASNLRSANFGSWPVVQMTKIDEIIVRDFSSNSNIIQRSYSAYSAFFESLLYGGYGYVPDGQEGWVWNAECARNRYQKTIARSINDLIFSDGFYYFVDSNGHLQKNNQNGDAVQTFGKFNSAPSAVIFYTSSQTRDCTSSSIFSNTWCPDVTYCNGQFGQNCLSNYFAGTQSFQSGYDDSVSSAADICGSPSSGGSYPQVDYQEGSNPFFNNPVSMIINSQGKIVIADSGNNRVRIFDPNTNSTSLFAGNGQTYDNGDGGMATSASIFHPLALATDMQGNLYIATERGLIRKVDATGRISTFAGKTASQGGVLALTTTASDVLLDQPRGLVIDDDNGFLYVADTGNHRIIRIDFLTMTATQVAGNGTCISGPNIGDGRAALDATLCTPKSVGLDSDKNLIVFDSGHGKIRRIIFDATTGSPLNFLSSIKDNSTMKKELNGTFTRNYRNGDVVTYDSTGKQTLYRNRAGFEVKFEYNANGLLEAQVDPVGGRIRYEYLGGKLTRIIDPVGRATLLSYSGDFLTQISFPDGTDKEFSYQDDGLITNEKDQRNFSTTYGYNQWKELITITRPDGSEISTETLKSKAVGNEFTDGEMGSLVSLGNPEIADLVTNARGFTTSLNQDESGFVSSITDASGQTTTIERDLDGRPLKIIRPDNTFATFTYNPDTGDLLTRHDSATGASISFTYNSFGQVTEQTNASGLVVNSIYNGTTGLLTSSSNSAGQSSAITYYALGLIKDQTNSLNQKIAYEYFPNGNVSAQIAPDNSRVDFERDPAGNVKTIIDAKSITNPKGRIVRREFDSWNRLTAVVSAKEERTEYSYLATGELSKVKDPLGKEVFFFYNSLGQLIRKVDQLGFETTLTYDASGNVITEVDPNRNLKTYQYDYADRLVKRILPDNVYDYSFNTRGDLVLAKNNISELDFEYESTEKGEQVSLARSRGLGVKSNYPDYELTYSFDEAGNRISMQTAVGLFEYEHDLLDRTTSVRNHKGELFNFNFDLGNRLHEILRPGGKTELNFDSTNFLTSIVHKKGSTALKNLVYERDQIGNRKKMTTAAGDFNYGFDLNSQIISASNPEVAGDFASENFKYDEIGNRIEDQLGGYLFDASKQRLAEDYRYFYYYDNNGNLTSKQSKTFGQEFENYIYNSENQMIRFESYENNTLVKSANYFYNAIGQRVEKVVTDHQNAANNLTRRYVYHDNEILHEMDQSNSILATYTHSGLRTDDTLAMDISSGGVSAGLALSSGSFYFLKDSLGSITEITNAAGEIIQRHIYSVFGKLLSVRDQNNQETNLPIVTPYFSYTNRELDLESGLYYYRARYYDSSIGRFLQTDPHPGSKINPLSHINKYVYAMNNPLSLTDPRGQEPITLGWAIFVIITTAIIASAIQAAIAEDQGGGSFHRNFEKVFLGNLITASLSTVFLGPSSTIGDAFFWAAFTTLMVEVTFYTLYMYIPSGVMCEDTNAKSPLCKVDLRSKEDQQKRQDKINPPNEPIKRNSSAAYIGELTPQ